MAYVEDPGKTRPRRIGQNIVKDSAAIDLGPIAEGPTSTPSASADVTTNGRAAQTVAAATTPFGEIKEYKKKPRPRAQLAQEHDLPEGTQIIISKESTKKWGGLKGFQDEGFSIGDVVYVGEGETDEEGRTTYKITMPGERYITTRQVDAGTPFGQIREIRTRTRQVDAGTPFGQLGTRRTLYPGKAPTYKVNGQAFQAPGFMAGIIKPPVTRTIQAADTQIIKTEMEKIVPAHFMHVGKDLPGWDPIGQSPLEKYSRPPQIKTQQNIAMLGIEGTKTADILQSAARRERGSLINLSALFTAGMTGEYEKLYGDIRTIGMQEKEIFGPLSSLEAERARAKRERLRAASRVPDVLEIGMGRLGSDQRLREIERMGVGDAFQSAQRRTESMPLAYKTGAAFGFLLGGFVGGVAVKGVGLGLAKTGRAFSLLGQHIKPKPLQTGISLITDLKKPSWALLGKPIKTSVARTTQHIFGLGLEKTGRGIEKGAGIYSRITFTGPKKTFIHQRQEAVATARDLAKIGIDTKDTIKLIQKRVGITAKDPLFDRGLKDFGVKAIFVDKPMTKIYTLDKTGKKILLHASQTAGKITRLTESLSTKEAKEFTQGFNRLLQGRDKITGLMRTVRTPRFKPTREYTEALKEYPRELAAQLQKLPDVVPTNVRSITDIFRKTEGARITRTAKEGEWGMKLISGPRGGATVKEMFDIKKQQFVDIATTDLRQSSIDLAKAMHKEGRGIFPLGAEIKPAVFEMYQRGTRTARIKQLAGDVITQAQDYTPFGRTKERILTTVGPKREIIGRGISKDLLYQERGRTTGLIIDVGQGRAAGKFPGILEQATSAAVKPVKRVLHRYRLPYLKQPVKKPTGPVNEIIGRTGQVTKLVDEKTIKGTTGKRGIQTVEDLIEQSVKQGEEFIPYSPSKGLPMKGTTSAFLYTGVGLRGALAPTRVISKPPTKIKEKEILEEILIPIRTKEIVKTPSEITLIQPTKIGQRGPQLGPIQDQLQRELETPSMKHKIEPIIDTTEKITFRDKDIFKQITTQKEKKQVFISDLPAQIIGDVGQRDDTQWRYIPISTPDISKEIQVVKEKERTSFLIDTPQKIVTDIPQRYDDTTGWIETWTSGGDRTGLLTTYPPLPPILYPLGRGALAGKRKKKKYKLKKRVTKNPIAASLNLLISSNTKNTFGNNKKKKNIFGNNKKKATKRKATKKKRRR